MSGKMRGKVVLITGAAGGLGLATAILLSNEKAKTIIMTDINEEVLNQTAKEVAQMGMSEIMTYKLDVSNEGDWKKLISQLEGRIDRLDVLINNAGINKRDTIENCQLEDWNRIIAVNQTGVFLGMKYCLDLLKRAKKSSIINLSSITGLTGYFAAAYTASKWAVRGMTKTAAMEFGKWGIRVNSVHPGFVWTPLNESISNLVVSSQKLTALERAGEPLEVSNAILFLASDDSSFVTGAEIVVDGGLTSGGHVKTLAKEFDIY
ncbi:SDR family NAD(P)-dependent oxidoreductase [Niallia sp. Krafla_26]|uniref:SDR family NAD(P)-dependent oxidoreductase n=1 Tax=Niallia sp. Krafla_26 TaxID=3064703 RepID=UPI003D16ADDD